MGRITVMLDDAATVAARELAQREQLTLGEAVSTLVRRGARISDEYREPTTSEFSQLGCRPGHRLTSEDVHALMDEDI